MSLSVIGIIQYQCCVWQWCHHAPCCCPHHIPSNPACSFSRTSQHHSLHRALCALFARGLLESPQAAAKLRVLFIQMLLATPTCCELVMTAGSIASFLPVKTLCCMDSLCCSSSLVLMAMFSSFGQSDRGRRWTTSYTLNHTPHLALMWYKKHIFNTNKTCTLRVKLTGKSHLSYLSWEVHKMAPRSVCSCSSKLMKCLIFWQGVRVCRDWMMWECD